MALKLPNLFGNDRKKPSDGELDMPTTQVKMSQAAQQGYDPLASVSIMDQLRTSGAAHGEAEEGLLGIGEDRRSPSSSRCWASFWCSSSRWPP